MYSIILYLFVLITGACLERRLPLTRLLTRVLTVLALASAQLLTSIQGLSLIHHLNGPWLFGSNLGCTAGAFLATCLGTCPADRPSWRTLARGSWDRFMSQGRQAPLALVILIIGGCFVLATIRLAIMAAPAGDSYHYEMPAFWVQHQTISPFSVNNPRILSLSFASEALALPGHMFLHTPSAMFALALVAALLTIWIVYTLAREMGCGFGAALCAAGMTPAYGTIVQATFLNQVDLLWSGVWVGGCIVFLLQSSASNARKADRLCLLGGTVFCFCLACGTKNIVLLSAPLFIACMMFLHGHYLWKPRNLIVLSASGLIGMLISGVVWNYAANQIWFGNYRGPAFMRETLAKDLSPVAVWTRNCRGLMQLMFDTGYVPVRVRPSRTDACRQFLRLLGADQELAEDVGFWGLNEQSFEPRQSLGPLGIMVFVPGVLMAMARCWRCQTRAREREPGTGRTNLVLVLICAGAFLLGHAILRWQEIGIARLLSVFFISGAPLAAHILTRRWVQVIALTMLLASSSLYTSGMMVTVAQRAEIASSHRVFTFLLRQLPDKSVTSFYHWKKDPVQKSVGREARFSNREFYAALLRHLPEATTIGVVGGPNTVVVWLFGPRYQNRIIPLVDCRRPDSVLDPPEDCRFVVFEEDYQFRGDDLAISSEGWAEKHGFLPVFEATSGHSRRLTAYERAY